ncbi:mucin-binding protein [Streptococcus mitis]|uniref:mucin-binding protein n=1 Tax=Streptococcus mitis TaxID=28037 RepID=UPI0039C97EAE
MPILADFSVIQDTVEPSKELAKRILTKLKEQGKITEDQEKKIKEEIDKSKKTSEVRAAMSGDVTVRYVDTNGNNLPITDADAKKAGEKTDNGYLVRKDVLIGTDYDVNSKKVSSFKATNGKYYALRSVGGGLETSSDRPNGSITKKNTVITFVYEERTTPPTGKGVVHFKKQTSETATEALTGYNDITLEGEVGKEFSTDEVNTKITELKNAGYEIVGDTFTSGDKTVDTVEDTEGQIPSQEYTITVKEKVVPVTEPPTPNTPVDPNVPDGPKWPATGLAKSDLEKDVTRTITYVKKDTPNGEEIPDAKPTVTQTAHFKRSATYNAVTGTITYGNWESADKELAKVDTPTLTGYVADKASVDKVATNADSTGLDQKVVYTKLGSWVPRLPEGVTPPTGTDMTPKPYPNNPTDPTKPGDPTDPNTPNVPVIPYVPGYTPSVGGTPLVPKVPNDPTQGYIPPAVPTEPGMDTPIEYAADPQKAVVKVFNTTTGTEVEIPAEKVSIDNGTTDSAIPTDSVTAKIADLEKRGYIVENKDLLKDQKFDKEKDPTDGDPTQVFKLLVKERTVTVTEPKNPNDPVDPDKPEGPKWPATGLAKSDLEKEVTRTITYVKKETADGPEIADAKPTKKQTAHFKRSATYNAVTGTITYGNWESADKELAKVDTPTLTGYVADKASVDKVETNAESTGLDQKVVYTKLGSWVPKVPGVETPTPLPYPNHPTDPTKPGDPTDPNTPNVPVIPYVPGYTPKIGETPLQPKVPNDPTQGYIPPAVPTEPGKDTPIEYVADPQKAVVKVFNTTTGTEVEIPAEKVSIDNGTTDSAIPTDSVTAKIADLEKRGYVVENKDLLNNQKFDKEKDPTDGDPTQVFKLLVKERTVTVTEPKNPNDPVDPDKPEGPKWPETGLAKSDLEKEVTRTITYVKKETADGPEIADAKPTVTQTAHFKRSATYNAVTGTITYGNWESADKELAKVDTPTLTGYVADKASVDKVETNADSTGLDQKVVYTKLGSWIPKVPGVETPTPLPYPNHPTDPTKPGDPTDPNTPNVPVIPYVPGYTPKIGETPLEPKVPNDPTQGYIPPVPTTPGEDTPITYEKVPNTPNPEQPETTGTKEVTRTIKYVDEKGNELAKPSTDKVTFKGKGSDWNAVGGDSTFDAVKSPVVKGYILKDPAQKVVAERKGITPTVANQTIEVVYKKLGSWIPKVPGVETPTPLPYPNHPTDPTKPGDPTDPNTPNVPVIPYVPGYTPKIGETPLEPVDPNNPENGYKVPPIPNTPGEDTPIEYSKDPQKAVVKVFNTTTGTEVELPEEKVELSGKTGEPIPADSVTAKIADLEKRGYIVENKDLLKDQKFDKEKDPTDGDPTQVFKLLVKERTVTVTEPKNPNDPVDPDKPEGPKWPETGLAKSDLEKEVTRTINYVDETGNKVSEPSTDKVTFTREAKINVVTGEITYGEWKAVGGDSTFDKVSSPVVKGYILKDPAQKEVAERKGITPTVTNQTIEVVYKKLGSWIPKVPGVETPTPLPYPNHPTDPTKPGDPTDPNTPNVPVIPYVPGYTPKIGETPLQPKVPNDPTQGYIPPAVPTEPGKDTPIEYVKVPNTPSPEEPVKPTPESNHITIWVDENGKPLKPEKPGTHEPGNIPGYRLITTVTKDGVTIHKFEKITPVEPNNPVPQKPTTPMPTPQDPTIPTPESQIPTPNTPEANTPTSETSRREELPNTGTEANANLGALGLLGALSGFVLLSRKKKED